MPGPGSLSLQDATLQDAPLQGAPLQGPALEVEDLTKALHGLEVNALDARHRFAARPDKNNPRTCDAISETMPDVVKNGKYQIMKILSIDESYALTIKSYGLEEVYKLKR